MHFGNALDKVLVFFIPHFEQLLSVIVLYDYIRAKKFT